MKDKILVNQYFQLARQLEKTYPETDFRDHCYWRIALDNILKEKWDIAIKRPAYKHLSTAQLTQVVEKLKSYLENKQRLLIDNQRSLNYRRIREVL